MSFETELRDIVREAVREVMREEMGPRATNLERELLTYEQAHARFSVSARTISRWVQARKLRAFGKGKLRRVRAEDVKACLEGAEPKTTNDVKSKVTSILATLGRK